MGPGWVGKFNNDYLYRVSIIVEKENSKMEKITINSLITTLNQIEVKGKTNLALLYNAIDVLQNALVEPTEERIQVIDKLEE